MHKYLLANLFSCGLASFALDKVRISHGLASVDEGEVSSKSEMATADLLAASGEEGFDVSQARVILDGESKEIENQEDELTPSRTGIYNSSDHEKIFYRYWDPKEGGSIRALFILVHGMSEHSERYSSFASEIADNLKVRVVAPDLRGHGLTACPDYVSDSSHLGELRKGEGAKCEDAVDLMSDDVIGVTNEMTASLSDSLPLVIFGHSMGTVIVRAMLKNSSADLLERIRAVILSGAPEAPGALEVLPLTLVVKMIKRTGLGAEFVQKHFITGKYDNQVKRKLNLRSVKENSFISSDPEEVEKFSTGKMLNHLVDPDIMISVVYHLRALQTPSTYFASLKGFKIPFLFVSGRDDPVCVFGATATTDAQYLKSLGHPVSELYLGDARHEFIFEVESVRSEGIALLAAWIATKLF